MKYTKRTDDLEEESYMKRPSANNATQKRPHKNLVKFWQEHAEDYDEIDEFFTK